LYRFKQYSVQKNSTKMIKPNKAMTDALKITVYGAGTVLLSTITSCAIAVVVERSAHRTLYHFFPEWYADVKYANGLPHLQHRNREGNDNTCVKNNNEDDQIIADIGSMTPKIEKAETMDFPDTRIENTFITTIISMISPSYREIEAPARNVEPFWNSESVLRRIKYNSTATSTTPSSSQFETYTNAINNKSERLSIDVHNCAMTAG